MVTASHGTVPPTDQQSIGQLLGRLSEQSSKLVRSEIELAKAEITSSVKKVGIGAGLLAGAAFFGFFAFAVLLATAIIALSGQMALWLAALLVAVVLLVLTIVLALLGKKRLDDGAPPTPERAVENVKLDVDAVKEGLH
ncbi:phage holin family protein [Cellulomonas cellasea]|uniref:VIT1/CCC1 family predicted Fe2+/Mn2+ transporter n=1 Tax=Cellulomonas cellasea TaxID=43670 RepID=A0A7W4UJQ6_9CELL|nr:phage holin family protein [Cellulomonas cellasea]MBB2925416.1 VIT1/CCC1 family predicted Fe2+/Mn2+ transporter [Cellulomonas cellasea]